MKRYFLIPLLVLPLAAAPPPEVKGSAWLERGLAVTESQKIGPGQWNKAQGDLPVPHFTDVRVDEELWIPVRHSVVGYSATCSASMPGFKPTTEHNVKGKWILRQALGDNDRKFNHPSGVHWRDLSIQALDCSGIDFGGAQTTTLSNFAIYTFGEIGVQVKAASHTLAIRDGYLAGHWNNREREGTCLRLDYVNGTTLDNLKLHRANRGIVLSSSSNITASGLDIEHVETPIVLRGGVGNRLQGRVIYCGEIIADFTQCGEFEATLHVNWPLKPGPQYYLDRDGKKRLLGTVNAKGAGRVFRFSYNRHIQSEHQEATEGEQLILGEGGEELDLGDLPHVKVKGLW